MANSLVQDLIESGIHFGQRTGSWNPKMQRFIYGKRNGIHIIDIKETVKGLLLAKKFVTRSVGEGRDIVFVGTKRQARQVLDTHVRGAGMPFVTERWLGGTLTNFRTIRLRLKRLVELEAIEANDNFASYSKKMESQLRREMKKIKRNLDGIRTMEKLPGAMVIIDVKREMNAIREAKKLGIPTICLIDTDGDPDLADIAIPGNDDSMRSIDVVVRELCAAVSEGKQVRSTRAKSEDSVEAEGDEGGGDRQRRSRRTQYRSDAAAPAEDAAATAGQ